VAIAGVWSKSMFSSNVATIGTSFTFTKTQLFDPPQNIMALPLLRGYGETDDESTALAYISEVVDGGVSKQGEFMGVVATSCTKIVWSLYLENCGAEATRLIFFF
jgi:hypothetical protein